MVLFFARDHAMFLFFSNDGVMDRKCVMCENRSNVILSGTGPTLEQKDRILVKSAVNLPPPPGVQSLLLDSTVENGRLECTIKTQALHKKSAKIDLGFIREKCQGGIWILDPSP